MSRIGFALRTTWGVASLFVVQSLLIGLAAAPGLLTWRYLLNRRLPWRGDYVESLLIGIAIVPGYFVFCVFLMLLTAGACRLLRWRAPLGEHPIATYPWPIVKWARYNALTHVVRLFAGSVLRATPLWTWFIRLNGATVGKRVHINTLSIYDHNLLTLGDGVVIGSDAKISGHTGQRGFIELAPVRLGERVTIGTNTIVQPDVIIGDRTVVGAQSLVPRGSRLEADSFYAGVPVERVRRAEFPTSPKA